jgi:hypothetical protein
MTQSNSEGEANQPRPLMALPGRVNDNSPHSISTWPRRWTWSEHSCRPCSALPTTTSTNGSTRVPVFERVLGATHPETLVVRSNFAQWVGDTGNAEAARDENAALVPLYQHVLGAEHYYTLIAQGSLAEWTGRAGDALGARDQYAALLTVHERFREPSTATHVRPESTLPTGPSKHCLDLRDPDACPQPDRVDRWPGGRASNHRGHSVDHDRQEPQRRAGEKWPRMCHSPP